MKNTYFNWRFVVAGAVLLLGVNFLRVNTVSAVYDDFTQLWRPTVSLDRGTTTSFYLQGLSIGEGNVFFTGSIRNAAKSKHDYLTASFTATGTLRWQQTYDGGLSNTNGDMAYANAYDSGFIYVTGDSRKSPLHSSALTIKYDSDGNQIFAWPYDVANQSNLCNAGTSIFVDNNFFYIAGATVHGTSSTDQTKVELDYLVMKYDKNDYSTTSPIWVQRFDGGFGRDPRTGTGISGDDASGVVVDSAGNVFVTGEAYNGTTTDVLTLKLDSNGNELWRRWYHPGADFGDDSGYAIKLDSVGNVYVAANLAPSPTGQAGAVLIYTSDGVGGPWGFGVNSPEIYALALDSSDYIYVTGDYPAVVSPYWDYYVAKYGNSMIWEKHYNFGSTKSSAAGLALDPQKNVYVAGMVSVGGTTSSYKLLKFAGSCTGPFNNSNISFTDATITPGVTLIRKNHLDELRYDTALLLDNAEARNYSIFPNPYSQTTGLNYPLTPTTTIKASHIQGVRYGLQVVNAICGQPAPTFTDATITQGTTLIRKTHIDELRQAVIAAP